MSDLKARATSGAVQVPDCPVVVLITRELDDHESPPPPLERWSAPLVYRARALDQRFHVALR